jgi:predicted PurR-regulated permease PerM
MSEAPPRMSETPIEKQSGPSLRTVTARAQPSQRIAASVVDIALVLLGIWVLRGFMSALAWAVVLTLATWPLYEHFQTLFSVERRRNVAPALFTLVIALVFIIPFGVAVVEIWREVRSVMHWVTDAEHDGLPVPAMVGRLPFFSQQITDWWHANLAEPGAVTDLLGRTDTGQYARLTQEVGIIIARRLTFFLFTILTLFFLFRDGVALAKRFRTFAQRLLGEPGEYLATLTMTAVRSTADGLVLVGLGEGAILGIAYYVFGAPHPALLAAFTGLLAMIPFGAPIIFTLASALLFFDGSIGAAAGVSIVGWVVIGIADHAIRPILIGGAAKLPFLWVLLGIFGGLETFGLVGLFLGPAIMAALVSLWREWTDPVPRRLNLKSGG